MQSRNSMRANTETLKVVRSPLLRHVHGDEMWMEFYQRGRESEVYSGLLAPTDLLYNTICLQTRSGCEWRWRLGTFHLPSIPVHSVYLCIFVFNNKMNLYSLHYEAFFFFELGICHMSLKLGLLLSILTISIEFTCVHVISTYSHHRKNLWLTI